MKRRPAWAALLVWALAGAGLACSGGGATERGIVYEASDGNATNVYVIDPQTAKTTQLTSGTGFDGNPAWAPDGKHIVFASNRDGGKNDLYVMDRDGGNARRLTTTGDASEFSPKFSSDGQTVAYVRQDAGGWGVWTMRPDGSDQRRVAGPYDFAEFPAFSPDATELYYSAIEKTMPGAPHDANAHIFSVNLSSGEVRTRIRTAGADSCPHFSRDGTRLTYASSGRGGGEEHLTIFAHDVASTDTTGASDTPLTDGSTRDDYPNPSPDDRQMVFISDRDGKAELYVMDRDGSNQRRLTETPDLRENVPDW